MHSLTSLNKLTSNFRNVWGSHFLGLSSIKWWTFVCVFLSLRIRKERARLALPIRPVFSLRQLDNRPKQKINRFWPDWHLLKSRTIWRFLKFSGVFFGDGTLITLTSLILRCAHHIRTDGRTLVVVRAKTQLISSLEILFALHNGNYLLATKFLSALLLQKKRLLFLKMYLI